jgi:hypothetical protein
MLSKLNAAIGLLAALTVTTLMFGQGDLATLVGTVLDQKGASIPQAILTVTNRETLVEGNYRIPNLKYGAYRVTVEQAGFKSTTRDNVSLSVGQTLRLDFSLPVGTVSESITISGTPPLLQTDTSELSTAITTEQFHQLPLQVAGDRRSPEMFMFLAPGVTASNGPNGSGAPGVGYFQVNGGPSDSSEVLLDGASARVASISGDFQSFTPSADAIGEFRLITNGYSAEYGRTGGGITSFSIKSGTNTTHGSLFEFLRNDKLDARGFFQTTRPQTRQNEYGGTVGGPVLIPKVYNGKNRTFFFVTLSGFRNRPGPPQQLLTLPRGDFRTGNFSQYTDSSGNVIPIYDPTTSRPDPSNPAATIRTPFPGNVIPANRISKVAAATVALLPQLTYPNLINFNTLAAGSATANKDAYTFKLDHNISDRNSVSLSFNRVLMNYITGPPLLPQPFSQNAHAQPNTVLARLSDNYTFSPNLVNHATFAVNREQTSTTGLSFGTGNQWPQMIGLSGVLQNFFPAITFSTDGQQNLSASFGTMGGFNSYLYNDTLSWNRGRHSLKFGFDIRREQLNELNFANSSGTYGFSKLETGLPGNSNSGYAFASFLLGAADTGSLSLPLDLGTRFHYYSAFVQDDFRISSKLTLNLGAGGIPGALIFAGSGTGRTGQSSFSDTDYKAFAPRVGLAYQIASRTVIRAGYGISYLPGTLNGGGGGSPAYTLGFTAKPTFSSADQGITPAFYLDNGFPQNFSRPPFIDPTFANGQNVYFVPKDNGRLPYMQNWSLNVQRELTSNMVLDVAYSASKGTRLLADNIFSLNQLDPKYLALGNLLNASITSPQAQAAGIGAPFAGFSSLWGTRATVGQALRPFPQYNTVTYVQPPAGNSTYNSLQAKLEKRFSKGLLFLASYTWSKNLTDTGANGQTFLEESGEDQYNRRLEKSLSPNDIPQVFAFSAVYELPFGPGKAFLNTGRVLGKIVGGWQMGSVLHYQSGLPLALSVTNTTGLFNLAERPNRVLGQPVQLSFSDPATSLYANPAAFSVPAPFTIGNAPRTLGDLRGPGFENEDVALWKDTVIAEKFKIRLRAEAFNVSNRVVFAAPSLNLSTLSQFGRISSQANNPRQMQVSVKFEF